MLHAPRFLVTLARESHLLVLSREVRGEEKGSENMEKANQGVRYQLSSPQKKAQLSAQSCGTLAGGQSKGVTALEESMRGSRGAGGELTCQLLPSRGLHAPGASPLPTPPL